MPCGIRAVRRHSEVTDRTCGVSCARHGERFCRQAPALRQALFQPVLLSFLTGLPRWVNTCDLCMPRRDSRPVSRWCPEPPRTLSPSWSRTSAIRKSTCRGPLIRTPRTISGDRPPVPVSPCKRGHRGRLRSVIAAEHVVDVAMPDAAAVLQAWRSGAMGILAIRLEIHRAIRPRATDLPGRARDAAGEHDGGGARQYGT